MLQVTSNLSPAIEQQFLKTLYKNENKIFDLIENYCTLCLLFQRHPYSTPANLSLYYFSSIKNIFPEYYLTLYFEPLISQVRIDVCALSPFRSFGEVTIKLKSTK